MYVQPATCAGVLDALLAVADGSLEDLSAFVQGAGLTAEETNNLRSFLVQVRLTFN